MYMLALLMEICSMCLSMLALYGLGGPGSRSLSGSCHRRRRGLGLTRCFLGSTWG